MPALVGMYHIDHFVYLVHDLDKMARRFGQQLGVGFSPGGRHQDRGTRNVLLRVGDRAYLELIAADPENDSVARPRWMGVDLLPPAVEGRLSRWSVATTGDHYEPALEELRKIDPAAGISEPGSRRLADGSLLEWRLSAPGAQPAVRALPFLIDWFGRATPAERLPDLEVRLTAFGGTYRTRLPDFAGQIPDTHFTPGEQDTLRLELTGPSGRTLTLTSD